VSVEDRATTEFADYGEILRRRWWLIVLGVVVGVAAAVVALQIVPKTYTSTALVQVKDIGDNGAVANGRTSSTLNLDTEAQLVTSNAVAGRARALLNVQTSARDLAKQVSVTVPPNTSVLSIGFSAASSSDAQAGAQAFADAYLANRKDSAEGDLEAQAGAIRDQIKDLQGQLADSNKRLATLSKGSPERSSEEATNRSLESQIRDLNSQLTPLVGQKINPGTIITDAQVPLSASNPSPKILLGSGLLAGLLAGALGAFAVDRRDKRIRERKDLERLGLDTMTGTVAVPAIRDAGSVQGFGPGAEVLRQLRNALLAQMPRRSGTVIVAGASDANAASAVSVSLAVTIARSGSKVVLLSANTVRCAVEQAFGAVGRPGLVDVLVDRVALDTAILEVDRIPNLRVLPAGADGSLSSDLLQGPKVESVIRELARRADVVIVDVAPTSRNADAQTLVTTGDGVLLVATAMKTTRDEILEAVDQFQHVSARVFGSAVVTVNRERHTAGAPRNHGSDDDSRPTTSTKPRRTPQESSSGRHEASLMTVRASAQ
jgi:capsular exopolysaccharide synthesis family protein